MHVESEAAAVRFTPPIAFDASAAELAAALEALENVQHVKVRRCDEMGGLGGAGGWLGGCAHADRGALAWLLTFEAPGDNRAFEARESVSEINPRTGLLQPDTETAFGMPLLQVYDERLQQADASRRGGTHDQGRTPSVRVERLGLGDSRVHASVCGPSEYRAAPRSRGSAAMSPSGGRDGFVATHPDGAIRHECAFAIEAGLRAGGRYAFRVRARLARGRVGRVGAAERIRARVARAPASARRRRRPRPRPRAQAATGSPSRSRRRAGRAAADALAINGSGVPFADGGGVGADAWPGAGAEGEAPAIRFDVQCELAHTGDWRSFAATATTIRERSRSRPAAGRPRPPRGCAQRPRTAVAAVRAPRSTTATTTATTAPRGGGFAASAWSSPSLEELRTRARGRPARAARRFRARPAWRRPARARALGAIPARAAALVRWAAPADTGGAPVVEYELQWQRAAMASAALGGAGGVLAGGAWERAWHAATPRARLTRLGRPRGRRLGARDGRAPRGARAALDARGAQSDESEAAARAARAWRGARPGRRAAHALGRRARRRARARRGAPGSAGLRRGERRRARVRRHGHERRRRDVDVVDRRHDGRDRLHERRRGRARRAR